MFHKVKFSNNVQRRHKSFVIFRLKSQHGLLLKQFKRVKFKEFKTFYNLDDNNTNRIVGFTPDYIGFRPGKLVKSTNYWTRYFIKKSHVIKQLNLGKYVYQAINTFREVWSGSPDTNTIHLKTFLEPNKNLITKDELIQICSFASSWFKAPCLEFNHPEELFYSTNFNPKAFPGHITSKVMQANLKGFTNDMSIILSKELYFQIRKFPIKNMTLWDLFAREKDIKVPIEGDVLSTTRCVLTTEEYVTHFLGWIFQKFMLGCEFGVDATPKFHIQGEYNVDKGLRLIEKSKKYDWVIDTDWSKFDSTIDTIFLLIACALMFSNSINSKEDMRMFYFVTESIITKNVIIPPGIVVELNRGNPSGHPGVTAINCYVNLMRWAVIGYNIYGEKFTDFMDIEVYGDDAYVFLKDHNNLDEIDNICNKYGFLSEVNVGRFFPTSDFGFYSQNSPDFLKRIITYDGIYWNYKKIFSKLFFQSKDRSPDLQVLTAFAFCETAPFDDVFNTLIYDFINFIRKNNQLEYETIKVIKDFYPLIDKARHRLLFDPKLSLIEGIKYEEALDDSMAYLKDNMRGYEGLKGYIKEFPEILFIFIQMYSLDWLNLSINYVSKDLQYVAKSILGRLKTPVTLHDYKTLSSRAVLNVVKKLSQVKVF